MFKPGDKIICVDDTKRQEYLTKGKIYTFSGYYMGSEVFLEGVQRSHRADRFRKVGRQRTIPIKRVTNVR